MSNIAKHNMVSKMQLVSKIRVLDLTVTKGGDRMREGEGYGYKPWIRSDYKWNAFAERIFN